MIDIIDMTDITDNCNCTPDLDTTCCPTTDNCDILPTEHTVDSCDSDCCCSPTN